MSNLDAFLAAVKAGNLSDLDGLIAKRPGILDDPSLAPSPVLLAVYYGKPDLANRMIEHGAKAGLPEAVALGRHSEAESALNDQPELVNQLTVDGFPLLGLAAFFGKAEVLQLLLTAGAKPNVVVTNAMRVQPLHSAIAHGNPEVALQMARLLLQAGADPNARQERGLTPLHAAAHHGHVGLVQLLLLNGADPKAVADDGSTPQQIAEKQGHLPAYRMLQGWTETD